MATPPEVGVKVVVPESEKSIGIPDSNYMLFVY